LGTYSTTDIGFAAYLLTQAVRLESSRRVRKKTTWVFALDSVDAQVFYNEWLQSKEFAFFSSYTGLKRDLRPTSGRSTSGQTHKK